LGGLGGFGTGIRLGGTCALTVVIIVSYFYSKQANYLYKP